VPDKKEDKNNNKKYAPTEQERKLVEWVYSKFKQAYVAKAPLMEKWKEYMSAYKGTYFQKLNQPDYKSNEISNLIFSTIETVRPIMTDNNPKFLAVPATPLGMEFSGDIQTALDYEWDREKMGLKLPAQLIPMLVYGNAVWFVQWDGKDGEYGNISIKPVDPFNIFPDPLAESIDNCEFLVYATYRHANQIKQQFPEKASAIEGSRITMSELVADRDKNDTQDANQVLILEMWCRDWITMDESVKDKKQLKYPKGRVITCLPELGILLSDKKNPYNDGKFPFVIMKNYDMPFEFWGVGEVEQLMSPQHYINELTNQIIDNAKNTANMQWIIDKNSGIGQGKLTNRPGLVIRKTPGSEVRRDTPPQMPVYVREQIEILKKDLQDISGVWDSLRGSQQGSITAASAILALQEASQARIRLKIKIMESSLSELAQIVYSRMQQFWKLDRWVRITDIEGNSMFRQINTEILENDYDLKVMAGSTMPVNRNAMLDLMIRLAQTNGEDGLPLVDRKAVLEFLPTGDKKSITDRFEQVKATQQQEQQQALQQQQEMAMQQQAQQKGELDQGVTEQVMAMLQQAIQANQITSQQVDELIADKEQRDKKEYESKIEEKGYKRGLKEGSSQKEKPEEEPKVDDEQKKVLEQQLLSENTQMEDALNSQQLPNEVVEELLNLAQQDPNTFREVLQAYPELAQMLQSDMQTMNGGMTNAQI